MRIKLVIVLERDLLFTMLHMQTNFHVRMLFQPHLTLVFMIFLGKTWSKFQQYLLKNYLLDMFNANLQFLVYNLLPGVHKHGCTQESKKTLKN